MSRDKKGKSKDILQKTAVTSIGNKKKYEDEFDRFEDDKYITKRSLLKQRNYL